MKNAKYFKEYLIITIIISILGVLLFSLISIKEYKKTMQILNKKIENIVFIVKEKYPKIKDSDIISLLNNKTKKDNIFIKYGIDVAKENIIKEQDKTFKKYLFFEIISIVFIISLIFITFIIYNKNKEKKIEEIIKTIEEINKKNYKINIDTMSEDSLSILKNEIYKTTIILKEAAENARLDKIKLKTSLEDISHQLKTPLTSILIMLDNILEDENMEQKTKEEFLKNIKRETEKINFLIQSLLKLSKFDANTINFLEKETTVSNIIKKSIENVSLLSDLKNIKINTKGENFKLKCDIKWQIEAITNIIKNCLEHSKNSSTINIKYGKNNIYSYIEIKDSGEGINKKDIKHIFERFYKGKNSKSERIGIGLALSKEIIEKTNGMISVRSDKTGTTFNIKYYKLN